jgi:hypothetical protein
MPPLNEQFHVAEDWLETIRAEQREQSKGNARHVYSLSYSLRKSAAGMKDGLRGKEELARRTGDRAQEIRIAQDIDKSLQNSSSWQPWKVTTSERTSEKEQRGLNFGAVFTANTTAEGQRGTSSYPK